jgi:glycosyltransferase involved in cell wall biosynthesis
MQTMQQPLTVAILTKNEEVLIERAIRSASFAEEVLVVDSGSTDQTCEIAARLGARVVNQPWLGWRGQHQRAVELAQHDWVMKVDADEVISSELAASIRQALASDPDPHDGLVVRRVDEFMGRIVPSSVRRRHREAFVRIFNRRFSAWDPDKTIHEKVKITGRFRKLSGSLLHWRNASLSRMLETYSANADVEAKTILKQHPNGPSLLAMAGKPVLRFGWSYIVCGNWRFGTLGFIRSAMQAMGQFISLAKAWEQRHARVDSQPAVEFYEPTRGRSS